MAEDPNGSEMAEKVVALKVQASRRLSSPGVKAEGGEAKIKLANLPAHVSKMLASMDSDGDGTLDWQEIFAGAQAHTEAVSKSKFFRKCVARADRGLCRSALTLGRRAFRLFVILFCLWLTQLACMFGGCPHMRCVVNPPKNPSPRRADSNRRRVWRRPVREGQRSADAPGPGALREANSHAAAVSHPGGPPAPCREGRQRKHTRFRCHGGRSRSRAPARAGGTSQSGSVDPEEPPVGSAQTGL